MMHPYRGEVRTVEEIAGIIGWTVERTVERIESGETLPVKGRGPVFLASDSASIWAKASARGGETTRQMTLKRITIDGVTHHGFDAAAKAAGCSARMLRERIEEKGLELTSEDLVRRREQRSEGPSLCPKKATSR